MAGQNRAGQVIEARLAALAQPALTRWSVVISAVSDHIGPIARRAPHTAPPALSADQVEALGIIEQTGQADQVIGHGTFAAISRIVPQSTAQVRIPLTPKHRGRPTQNRSAITLKPIMSLSEFPRWVAMIGGYLGRRGDGDLGWNKKNSLEGLG
jgi:hypothetical protein